MPFLEDPNCSLLGPGLAWTNKNLSKFQLIVFLAHAPDSLKFLTFLKNSLLSRVGYDGASTVIPYYIIVILAEP